MFIFGCRRRAAIQVGIRIPIRRAVFRFGTANGQRSPLWKVLGARTAGAGTSVLSHRWLLSALTSLSLSLLSLSLSRRTKTLPHCLTSIRAESSRTTLPSLRRGGHAAAPHRRRGHTHRALIAHARLVLLLRRARRPPRSLLGGARRRQNRARPAARRKIATKCGVH